MIFTAGTEDSDRSVILRFLSHEFEARQRGEQQSQQERISHRYLSSIRIQGTSSGWPEKNTGGNRTHETPASHPKPAPVRLPEGIGFACGTPVPTSEFHYLEKSRRRKTGSTDTGQQAEKPGWLSPVTPGDLCHGGLVAKRGIPASLAEVAMIDGQIAAEVLPLQRLWRRTGTGSWQRGLNQPDCRMNTG